jgi:hypothetical protein
MNEELFDDQPKIIFFIGSPQSTYTDPAANAFLPNSSMFGSCGMGAYDFRSKEIVLTYVGSQKARNFAFISWEISGDGSSLVVRASGCQCQSCISPEFYPSILPTQWNLRRGR